MTHTRIVFRVFAFPTLLLLCAACGASHEGHRDGGGGADTGGSPECHAAIDCLLVPRSCCGSCGVATPDDMIAIRRDGAGAYRDMVCEDIVGCPPCIGNNDPFLFATCAAGDCAEVNLRQHPLTECTANTDCVITTNGCCPPCGTVPPDQVIAYNPSRGNLLSLTCGADVLCPDCSSDYGSATALCVEGRCQVVFPEPLSGP